MREATCEHDLVATPFGKAIIGLVTIALQDAAKVGGDDLLQAGRSAADFPVEEDIALRPAARP